MFSRTQVCSDMFILLIPRCRQNIGLVSRGVSWSAALVAALDWGVQTKAATNAALQRSSRLCPSATCKIVSKIRRQLRPHKLQPSMQEPSQCPVGQPQLQANRLVIRPTDVAER